MVLKKQVYSKPFNLVYESSYPNLIIGPGTYSEINDAKENSPKNWILENITKIEKNRSKQIFAYKNYSKNEAKNPNKDILEIQHLVKSEKETELEINVINKKINLTDKITGINNKGITLDKIKIIDHIKVSKPIDKITNDTQIKAKDAIIEFYDKTNDPYKIEQLLSMGLLGLKKDRIFVPTRWSITCIDDTLGKNIFPKIENNPVLDKFKMHKFEFYENIFYIFFMPYSWGFEIIEYVDLNPISMDFEINNPKKEYAYQVMGGYYAARLMVMDYLDKIQKCSRVLILRDIKPTYNSKGVWVIREAIREALKTEETIFEDLNDLIKYIANDLKITWILQKSEILKQIKFQKRLFDF